MVLDTAKEDKTTQRDKAKAGWSAKAASVFGSARGRQFLLAGALTVVAGLLIWLALFFKVELNESEASTGNTALVDVAKTSQVKQDVDSAVETLFSYKYNDTAKTENAAKDLLINDQVRAKYAALFEQVKLHAPEQKLVVTVKAVRSAVVTLDGDRARVLVFVDQTSLRTATGDQAVVGGGQIAVNAELRDGKWKIADLDGYGDTQQPTPSQGSAPASSEVPIPGSAPATPASPTSSPAR